MHRTPSAVALLVSLAFATTVPAQIRGSVPLPAAQSENHQSLVAKAQAALDAKRWPDAEAALKELSTSERRWEYSEALGNAHYDQGHFADSLESYQRAIDLAQNSATPAATAALYTMIGNANLKLRQNDAAIAAFNKVAALGVNPAVSYFNLCAIMYNIGQTGAKTKAIAADPRKADAYFVKGSSKLDKNNKYTVPPGTVEALKQYLVLAPNGPHAQDVKSMLDGLKLLGRNERIKTKGRDTIAVECGPALL
jgi:tetratricopeptide (TPR) repeat protein